MTIDLLDSLAPVCFTVGQKIGAPPNRPAQDKGAVTTMGTRAQAAAKGAKAPAKAAAAKKAPAKRAAAPKAPRVKKEPVLNDCACATFTTDNAQGEPLYDGCGGKTTRSFLPGHDARLKGALIKAHRAGQKLHLNGQHLDPMTVARSRGWEEFLTKELKPRPKREPKPKAEKAEKASVA